MRKLFIVLLAASACGTDDQGTIKQGFEDKQVIVDFADKVVVPTYTLLAARADDLVTAVATLADAPTPTSLDAAKAAWMAMRVPWEESEGFLFGPVSSFGYDPSLDSWPVNRTDLDLVLAGDDELTTQFVSSLGTEQKGFHTVEYLLFGEAQSRTADFFTDAGEGARRLTYLSALAAEMQSVAHALLDHWTTSVGGFPSYRDVFATAGEPGNSAYTTLTAAAQEILGGMSGICDEVANGKIADPYDNADPNLVESQFSFNSLLDFADNMKSVRNAYLGGVPLAGTSGRGLTAFVASEDADLDARVKAAIDDAISAVEAVPAPFSETLADPSAASDIEAAQAAIRNVQALLDGEVLPLVLGE